MLDYKHISRESIIKINQIILGKISKNSYKDVGVIEILSNFKNSKNVKNLITLKDTT